MLDREIILDRNYNLTIEYKKISSFRMFFHILESSVFSILLIFVSDFLLGLVLFPLLLMLIPLCFLITLVSLPSLLFFLLPLSLFLYKRKNSNMLAWMGWFTIVAIFYCLILGVAVDQKILQGIAIFLLHGTFTGFFMWGKLFGHRFDGKQSGSL